MEQFKAWNISGERKVYVGYLKEMVLIVLVLSRTQLLSSSAMSKLQSMFPSQFAVVPVLPLPPSADDSLLFYHRGILLLYQQQTGNGTSKLLPFSLLDL